MQCNFPTLAYSSSSLNHCAHGTEPVRARKQAVQSAPAFEETSLNANPHIFLSVCSFLLIDMGLIGNEAKEETDCVLYIIWTSVLWHILHKYKVGYVVSLTSKMILS